MKIVKILVANRGEIALRILRSAKEMGISTVAIYSEADVHAPFVKFADEAICIGPPPSSESYLAQDKVIEIAKKTGANAIHPGYGFLSENAEFAEKVSSNGMIFIGPSPEAIRKMGDKLEAKKTVSGYDVPQVPGMNMPLNDLSMAKKLAGEIGYPVLIKASAGGGGKGMRIVEREHELEEQIKRAKSEAKSSFGDSSVFIEKFIESPKHIEVQILGDSKGNVLHFFERECSIQRRHQKVIEEAPSPSLSDSQREKIYQAAINVAKSCNYTNAGTVEFIVDENRDFYFLEMNTRLQVEHPVSEEISGIDLVQEQIKVAQGEALTLTQNQIIRRGHSIEVRVYAEDPSNDFLPDTGKLHTYRRPTGPGIRVDDGFEEGMEIPIYYDPMISKLVATAQTREQAIERMKRAIDEYSISGINTTLAFCKFVLDHPEFRDGSFTTKFVETHFTQKKIPKKIPDLIHDISAAIAFHLNQSTKQNGLNEETMPNTSRWKNRLRMDS